MASLAKCIKPHTDVLSESEQKQLADTAKDLQAEGMASQDAETQATEQMLDDAYAERETLADAVKKAGGKPVPAPIRFSAQPRRLDEIELSEETVEGPEGEQYTVTRTAAQTLGEIDMRIMELNKIMECLHGP